MATCFTLNRKLETFYRNFLLSANKISLIPTSAKMYACFYLCVCVCMFVCVEDCRWDEGAKLTVKRGGGGSGCGVSLNELGY